MTKRSPEKIDRLRRLAGDGATATQISRDLGVSISTVIKWAAVELIRLPTVSQARKAAWADPEVRARMKASRAGAKGVLIPKWIPADLHDEFLEIAAKHGEESAASHIRRLKAAMQDMRPTTSAGAFA